MILQIDSIPVGKLMEVSPFNTLAYGVLVVILFTAVMVLYKKAVSQEEYLKTLVDKIHGLQEETGQKLTEIKVRMNDQNDMMKTLEYIKTRIDDIIK